MPTNLLNSNQYEAIKTLEKEGLTRFKYPHLFFAICNHEEHASNLVECFIKLFQSNFLPNDYPLLYKRMVDYPELASPEKISIFLTLLQEKNEAKDDKKLSKLLYQILESKVSFESDMVFIVKKLLDTKLSYIEYKSLYQKLFSLDMDSIKEIKVAMNALDRFKLPLDYIKALYEGICLNGVHDAKNLVFRFHALKASGMYINHSFEHFEHVLYMSQTPENLSEMLKVLKKFNIPYQEKAQYPLFAFAANNAEKHQLVNKGLQALVDEGLNYTDNANLYIEVVKNISGAENLSEIFKSFKALNINFIVNPSFLIKTIQRAHLLNGEYITSAISEFKKLQIYSGNEEALVLCVINHNVAVANLIDLFQNLSERGIDCYSNVSLTKAIIINSHWGREINDAFVQLKEMHIDYKNDTAFSIKVINEGLLATCIPLSMEQLAKAGFSCDKDSEIYGAIFRQDCTLPDKIALLQKEGVTSSAIYKKVMESYYTLEELIFTINFLKENNISFQDELGFFEEKTVCYSSLLPDVFNEFNLAGIDIANNSDLQNEAILNAYNAQYLMDAIIKLSEGGIKQKELYHLLIKADQYAPELSETYIDLYEAGIYYADNQQLFEEICINIEEYESTIDTFHFLLGLKLNYSQYPWFYTVNTLIKHNSLIEDMINLLCKAGYDLHAHQLLFKMIVTFINDGSLLVVSEIVKALCDYAAVNKLVDAQHCSPQKQINELIKLITDKSQETPLLAFGPLNKNESTIGIEKVLEMISNENVFNTAQFCFYNEFYYIVFPYNQIINLSILLDTANLTQITLPNQLIDKLGGLVSKFVSEWDVATDNQAIAKLPASQRAAFNLYLNYTYKNINLLFRGEKLDNDVSTDLKWIVTKPEHRDKLIAVNFILGCLLSDAANKIDNLCERNNNEVILDRKEDLTQEEISQRIVNPSRFPNALTSFSLFKEGSNEISIKKTIHTKLDNGGAKACINGFEGEVVFAHGTQVITRQLNPQLLVSTLVSSPSIDYLNQFWQMIALQYAFDNYLVKAYKDENRILLLQNVSINRANHGLPHSYRVMNLIPHIINYEAEYAKEKYFREFCLNLTETQIRNLQIAAAFSVTGRESEKSFIEAPGKYWEYRKSSADKYKAFIDALPSCCDSVISERMYEAILYMGNPGYEANYNMHPDLNERRRRNYFKRLLTIAHNVDLARCYSAKEYKKATASIFAFSVNSVESDCALKNIIRYNNELIKVHGNHLSCDIRIDGQFVDVDIPYNDDFAKVSQSLKKLVQVSQKVKTPPIMLPFQFVNQTKKSQHKISARELKSLNTQNSATMQYYGILKKRRKNLLINTSCENATLKAISPRKTG